MNQNATVIKLIILEKKTFSYKIFYFYILGDIYNYFEQLGQSLLVGKYNSSLYHIRQKQIIWTQYDSKLYAGI